jgi:hypothetical protein
MKKILFLIAGILFTLVCCSCNKNAEGIEVKDEKDNYKVIAITEFTYSGHDYLIFTIDNPYHIEANAVHNPECKRCKRR